MVNQKLGIGLVIFIALLFLTSLVSALNWVDTQYSVNDNLVLYLDQDGQVGVIGYGLSNGPTYDFEVGGVTYINNSFFVDGIRRVGINTVTPSMDLDIRGDLNVSGVIYQGNHSLLSTSDILNDTFSQYLSWIEANETFMLNDSWSQFPLNDTFSQYDTWNYNSSINLQAWVIDQGYQADAMTSEALNLTGYLIWDDANQTFALNDTFLQYGLNDTFGQYDTWNYNSSINLQAWVIDQGYTVGGVASADINISITNAINAVNTTQNIISLSGALNASLDQYLSWLEANETFGLNDTFGQYDPFNINFTLASLDLFGLNDTFGQYDTWNRNDTVDALGLFGLNSTFTQYLSWLEANQTFALNDTFSQYLAIGSTPGADNTNIMYSNATQENLTIQGWANITHDADFQALRIFTPGVSGSPTFELELPLSTDLNTGKAFGIKPIGKTFDTIMYYSDGKYCLGSGDGGRDVCLDRNAAGIMEISSDGAGGNAELMVNLLDTNSIDIDGITHTYIPINGTFSQYDAWNHNQSARSITWVEDQGYATSSGGADNTNILYSNVTANIRGDLNVSGIIWFHNDSQVPFNDTFSQYLSWLEANETFGLNDTFSQYDTWNYNSSINLQAWVVDQGYQADAMTSEALNLTGYLIWDDANQTFALNDTFLQYGLNDTFSQYLSWLEANETFGLNDTFGQYDALNYNMTAYADFVNIAYYNNTIDFAEEIQYSKNITFQDDIITDGTFYMEDSGHNINYTKYNNGSCIIEIITDGSNSAEDWFCF